MECHNPNAIRQCARPKRALRLQQLWREGVLCLLAVLLQVGTAAGQGERRAPAREDAPGQKSQQAPVRESKAAPLPANKLEEALRLLLKATSDSTAAAGPQRPQRTLEIEGLIVDQTISKVGHDFYDIFYTQFEAPPGIGEYVVTITEKPGRGTSTLISLNVNETDLLEMPLQPKQEYIEAVAADAVNAAIGFLEEARSVSRQLEKGGKQPLETF
ncbi:CsgE family curli-type amyloid fiber assembly protein [Hymenobacter psychrotolerans]|uniref:Curli production assembly/transport component CsgE n=1 Tax=Hymenobacter psychrotolerans DSM 18569 TaxID=1121959 RepID=A0A1M6XHR7_9BACT|nr:CsgE family curli-type amyloid fiber assembly protein [Hymenobacter psychrotolerans]SHL05453.1 curli production assembly/transport component CsgE [Hymenobacter psychrotolerans DSM 18569]